MGFYRSAKFFYTLSFILVAFLNISYAEDIILTGNQVLRIENTTYSTKGNIYLYDNSSLIIRNSVFNFIQDYHEQYGISLKGNASLVIENGSTLTSTQRFTVSLFDSSRASVLNSSALNVNLDWPRGAVFTPNDNAVFECNNSQIDAVGDQYSYLESTKASISITDSTVQALSFVFPLSSVVTLNNIQKGYINTFQILKQNTGLPYDLVIANSTIANEVNLWAKDSSRVILNGCNFTQVRADQKTSLTLINTVVDQIIVSFFNDTFDLPITGLSGGKIDDYILDLSMSNSFYIELRNTIVGGWVIKIVNCPNSNFRIINCKLILLRPMNGNFNVTIVSSTLDELWMWDFSGTLSFENCVVGNWSDTRNYPPAINNFFINGTVTFNKADLINQALGDQWLSTIVRRNYPCHVSANYPDSTIVRVYDPYGQKVFEGKPAHNGQITTSAIFYDSNNYNQSFKMQLMYQSQVLDQVDLKIASSTPIKLSTSILLPPPPKSRSMPWLILLLDD